MRIQVRKRHNHTRMLAIIVGLLVLVQVTAQVISVPPLQSQVGLALSAQLILVGAVLCIVCPTRCQHLTWCAVYGAVIGAAPLILPLLSDVASRRAYVSFLHPTTLLVVLTLLIVGGAIGSGMLCGWAVFYRHAVCRVEIQDGTLCPTCAYCIAHLPTNVCPECGNAFVPLKVERTPTPVGSVEPYRQRKHLVGIVTLVGLVVVLVGARWFAVIPPVYAIWTSSYWGHVLRRPDQPRGTPFVRLSGMLVAEAKAGRYISPAEVRSILGPPDLFMTNESGTHYLYFYTENRRREAYLDFVGGGLTSGGYNTAGVNDLSVWRPYEPNS